jgi:stage II sporulation protein D
MPARATVVDHVTRTGGFVALVLAIVLVLPALSAADGDLRFDGHGWGHGVGLAQYGARGYAEREGRSYGWILAHYYPGTRLREQPRVRIRVLLRDRPVARVVGASRASDRSGRVISLSPGRTYRLSAWGSDRLRLSDATSDRTRARLRPPVRLASPGKPLVLLGQADNGVRGGRYRGDLVARRAGDGVLIVNHLGLERYLRGVLAGEMPAGWPAEALRAQAVAARSYALRSQRPEAPFDVHSDTRSQVYRGVAAETPSTTDAVDATRGLAVTVGDSVALTLFHSSSGGRTAAVEEVFRVPPMSYLVSVDDPYDRISPYHAWTVTMTREEAARRLTDLVPGGLLVGLDVIATTPSGRAAVVRITGVAGTRDIDAATARARLGLRSTWFIVHAGAR